jgi:hypothetical protein
MIIEALFGVRRLVAALVSAGLTAHSELMLDFAFEKPDLFG